MTKDVGPKYPDAALHRAFVLSCLFLASNSLAQQPSPPTQAASAPSTVSPAIQERDVFNGNPEAAARLDNAPIDPTLAGFIPIPGSDSMIKPYGTAKLDVIHDFNPAGEANAFITSTIPVGPITNAQNTAISARQSKIGLEFRRPTPLGDLRVVYENDFYDFTTGKTTFNLRQFYGQVDNLLAGFTYSTILDPDAMPDTLDFEGPGSMVFIRQAGVRYTFPLDADKKQTLAVAIENGTSDIQYEVPAPTPVTVTPTSPWPDMHIRYRYEGETGHVQLGAVFRSVGGYADDLAQQHVFGYGASLAGSQQIGTDFIMGQATYGRGIARYIQDLTGLGGDVGLENGKMVGNDAFGAYLAYQHYWHPDLRSSVMYGYTWLDSKGKTFTSTFHDSNYVGANLIWNPKSATLHVGLELLYGNQMLVDGEKGSATRIQVSFSYDLVK
jgi:DcaP outer membrane protein